MIIAVAQQKGGSGKTTLSTHIAVGLAARGAKVTLIDIDPQGSLNAWFAMRTQIAASKPVAPLSFKAISGWKVESELSRLKKQQELIVVDTPPHADQDAKAVVRLADQVIVPMQPSALDLWACQPTLDLVKCYQRTPIVVFNRVNARSKLIKTAIDWLKTQAIEPCPAMLSNRVLFAEAMANGLSVTELKPNSIAAEEVHALVNIIG